MGRRLECGFCAHRFDVVINAPRGTCPRCAAHWSGDGRGLLDWDKPELPKKTAPVRADTADVYYVTKYALSTGILEVLCMGTSSDSFVSGGYLWFLHKGVKRVIEPKEWFTDLAQAQARAEELRAAKIKSLQKQIDKLHKKIFVNKDTE